MKRIISLLLAIIFVASVFSVMTYASDGSFPVYEVSVLSSEFQYDSCHIYEVSEDKYYMSLYDVVRYTRSAYRKNANDPNKVTITHGSRELALDLDKGVILENGKTKSIGVVRYEQDILVHAVPLLSYLGADCDVDGKCLVISMPAFTLWEAIYPTGYENYVRMEDVFSGESNLKISTRLVLNGIIKFLESGIGDAVNAEKRSILLALQVDVSNYDKYFDTKAKEDIKNLNLFESMTVRSEAAQNFVDVIKTAKTADKVLSVFKGPASSAIAEQLEDFGDLSSSILMASFSSISETLKTQNDSFDIVSATLRYMPKDARFYNNLDRAQKKLNSDQDNVKQSLISNTVLKAITEELIDNADEIVEKNQEKFFKLLGKSNKVSIMKTLEISIEIGVWWYKAFYGQHNGIDQADAETAVIELLRLKKDVADSMDILAKKVLAENYSNASHLEDYRLMRVFYYRILIALNEQMERMIDSQMFKSSDPEMRKLIRDLQDQSNLFAEKLYMLTVCDVSAFADIDALSKENAWDGKIDPLELYPETPDYDGGADIVLPENAQTFWGFDYNDEHPALMRSYYDENEKLLAVEKYPLYDCYFYEKFISDLEGNSRLTCLDTFGTVSEKYVFNYNGDKLDNMVCYHASESHLGVRSFKKSYVMRFEEHDSTLYPTVKGSIYVNGSPTHWYDIFEYRDDCIVRTEYNARSIIEETQYSLQGRPEFTRLGTSSNSDVKYMSYDENGNIVSANICYRGHPLDISEGYGFTFEDDKLVKVTYQNNAYGPYNNVIKTVDATLSYNDKDLFVGALVKYSVDSADYDANYSVEYDDLNRVTKSQYADEGEKFSLSYVYNANGCFDKITLNYEHYYSSTPQSSSADISFEYGSDQRLVRVTYPDFTFRLNYDIKTLDISYSSSGDRLNDGKYTYEYYSSGKLKKRSEVNSDSYVVYHQNGLKKEEKYYFSGYSFVDYYDRADFACEVYELNMYWNEAPREMVSAGGSDNATRSVAIHSNGTKYEVERTFSENYMLEKAIIWEYSSSNILVSKTTRTYDTVFGGMLSNETVRYDENGNVIN